MKFFTFLLFLCSTTIFADNLSKYFELINSQKIDSFIGNHENGEIEIILDKDKIKEIEKIQENRFLKKGFSKEFAKESSKVGVVFDDFYWIIVRDAVLFPGKAYGTYDRLIWKSSYSGDVGVAILPIINNKIVLNLNFRHATRSWELELPRGKREENETNDMAALRELKEETGYITNNVQFLGKLAPDSGVMNSIVPIFLAKVSTQNSSNHDYSEAIFSNPTFTVDEIKKGLKQGYLEIFINKQKQRVNLRDPFLSYALLIAILKGYI